jgi:hypothetical protein
MDVSDQLQQIGVFFTDDGFIAILEQMPHPTVAVIEGHGISGHEPPHDSAQGCLSGPYQQVEMIGNKSPRVTLGLAFLQDLSKSYQEIFPVRVIDKYQPSFDPTGHDMLQDTGCIQSGLTGHRL